MPTMHGCPQQGENYPSQVGVCLARLPEAGMVPHAHSPLWFSTTVVMSAVAWLVFYFPLPQLLAEGSPPERRDVHLSSAGHSGIDSSMCVPLRGGFQSCHHVCRSSRIPLWPLAVPLG